MQTGGRTSNGSKNHQVYIIPLLRGNETRTLVLIQTVSDDKDHNNDNNLPQLIIAAFRQYKESKISEFMVSIENKLYY
jgi:hypothetical protein